MTGVPSLGPRERQFLLSCGRLTLDAATRARAEQLLAEPLAWDAVLFHARLHSVASMLYHHIDAMGKWELVPEPSRLDLRRLYHRAGYQNHVFARENALLLRTFAEHGVPVIVQKGISLVERIYRKPALRPLIDLVFLTQQASTREAVAALRQLGYEERRLTPREMLYRWCCPQLYFVAERELTVAVLLQNDLVNWPRIHRFSSALLWGRAERTTLGGQTSLVLSPVDQLLYLCLQADNHGSFNRVALQTADSQDLLFTEWTNNRQIRFTDIFEVATRYRADIDWDLLVERAREGEIEEAVFTSLTLTNRLLGPVAEPDILGRLLVERRSRLRRWLYQAITYNGSGAQGKVRNAVRQLWLDLPPRSQLHVGRVIGLIEFCFPEPALLRSRYGIPARALVPALYVLHATFGVLRSAHAYATRWLANFMQRVRGAIVRRLPFATRQGARA